MSDRSVSDVRSLSKSTGYAKFLLMTIASHVHPQAVYAYPSLDTLARETTLSKPTVLKLIAVLVALGELEVIRGRGRGHSNRYRITIVHEAPQGRPAEHHDDQPKGQDPRHQPRQGWSVERNDDQPKGKGRVEQPPQECSDEGNADQPKGKPYLYLLPTPSDMEKVNATPEKVNNSPGKGQPSLDSKEVLRTSKETTERGPMDWDVEMVKVNGHDHHPDEWIMKNAVYGTHRRCGHDHQPGTPCYLLPAATPAPG